MIADWICSIAAYFGVHQLLKNSGYSADSVQWTPLERDIKNISDDPPAALNLSNLSATFAFS